MENLLIVRNASLPTTHANISQKGFTMIVLFAMVTETFQSGNILLSQILFN